MFVPAVDLGDLVRAILFLLFADLTAILVAIIGPTYDNLLVPELAPSSLYPAFVGPAAGGSNYLAVASRFSTYLLGNVVDPLIALIALAVAFLYFSRVFVARWASGFDGLLPRLIVAVVAANFTVSIAGAIVGLAGSAYPVFAGWDGGSWQQWANLAGYAELAFSWDNGALAFVLAFVEFLIVLGLVLAIGVRDALLAVLLVLLPVLTLLWPIRPVAAIARRAWLLFVELAFLPCVVVVPLELAVGSPSAVLLVAYLGIALAAPYLVSVAGTHLVAFGFPASGAAATAGVQRGLGTAPAAAAGYAGPAAASVRTSGAIGRAAGGTVRVAGSATAPAAAPLAIAEAVGHGALHLVRHVRGSASGGGSAPRVPPFRGGGQG